MKDEPISFKDFDERDRKNPCDFRDVKVEPYMVTPSGHKNHTLKPYACKLERYYNEKYGQTVTPIALLKTLSVISSKFRDNLKLWILHIAPSRQLKSKTSLEQERIFSKNKLVYTGSDLTMHSIERDYGNSINNKCFLINDLNLLLQSKAYRTKARLIDGLSELASEGKYVYSDFQKGFTIEAKFSLIANITPQSYLYNQKNILGNTFTDRCLKVYHELTPEEMSDANLNRKERQSLKPPRFKQSIKEKDVTITREDLVRFNEYAKRWRILGAYTSSSQTFDMIKSVAIAHAILSGQPEITGDQYRFLDMLEPHIRSPFESVKLAILELAYQGRSIKDICLILDRDYDSYRSFVSRTINEYRRRGILPSSFNKSGGVLE